MSRCSSLSAAPHGLPRARGSVRTTMYSHLPANRFPAPSWSPGGAIVTHRGPPGRIVFRAGTRNAHVFSTTMHAPAPERTGREPGRPAVGFLRSVARPALGGEGLSPGVPHHVRPGPKGRSVLSGPALLTEGHRLPRTTSRRGSRAVPSRVLGDARNRTVGSSCRAGFPSPLRRENRRRCEDRGKVRRAVCRTGPQTALGRFRNRGAAMPGGPAPCVRRRPAPAPPRDSGTPEP